MMDYKKLVRIWHKELSQRDFLVRIKVGHQNSRLMAGLP